MPTALPERVVPQRVVWTMPGCRHVCEGCGAKEAIFGTPSERKRRWCRGCSKAPGAINLSVKMCEGCGAKEATFGTPLERKRRWCRGCSKAPGAINLNVKMCEGCDAVAASHASPPTAAPAQVYRPERTQFAIITRSPPPRPPSSMLARCSSH